MNTFIVLFHLQQIVILFLNGLEQRTRGPGVPGTRFFLTTKKIMSDFEPLLVFDDDDDYIRHKSFDINMYSDTESLGFNDDNDHEFDHELNYNLHIVPTGMASYSFCTTSNDDDEGGLGNVDMEVDRIDTSTDTETETETGIISDAELIFVQNVASFLRNPNFFFNVKKAWRHRFFDSYRFHIQSQIARSMLKKNEFPWIINSHQYTPQQFSIDLSYYTGKDVSALANVGTLNLSNCKNLSDVSPLVNVNSLNLSKCRNLHNVSMLGNVHTLNLSYCDKIKDVSALGNVTVLNLSNCHQVSDVSALINVYDLNLSACANITDVSALNNVHKLNLSCCNKVTDVSPLRDVHTLNLSMCTGITDVSALSGVRILIMHYCDKKSTQQQSDICNGVTGIAGLTNVQKLIFTHNSSIESFPTGLYNLRELDLSGCLKLTHIDYHNSRLLQSLNLSGCKNLKNVSNLGCLKHLKYLNLSGCEKIVDVSALSNVHILDLSWCTSITDVSALRNVPKDLTGCIKLTKQIK